MTRREMMDAEDGSPEMPPVEWGQYLLDYLWEVGPTMVGGMGSVPLPFSEIEAWQRQIGLDLQPWEVRLLRRLSQEYLAESHRATERNCPAPWQPDEHQPERMLAAIDQRDAFRSLAKL